MIRHFLKRKQVKRNKESKDAKVLMQEYVRRSIKLPYMRANVAQASTHSRPSLGAPAFISGAAAWGSLRRDLSLSLALPLFPPLLPLPAPLRGYSDLERFGRGKLQIVASALLPVSTGKTPSCPRSQLSSGVGSQNQVAGRRLPRLSQ